MGANVSVIAAVTGGPLRLPNGAGTNRIMALASIARSGQNPMKHL